VGGFIVGEIPGEFSEVEICSWVISGTEFVTIIELAFLMEVLVLGWDNCCDNCVCGS
jgi:hypothetical protein